MRWSMVRWARPAHVGTVFSDGPVGQVPLYSCATTCSMYFTRATTTDFSGFQIYTGSTSGVDARGKFVEVAQGFSGPNYLWSATSTKAFTEVERESPGDASRG